MGDPRKLRKKYETPNHPWNKTAIDEQKVLMREYGLGNKKELYLANSFVKKYRKIAKTLIVDTSNQGIKEKDQMMNKLQALGLLSSEAKIDDVLGLELKDILERRLQTLVFRKGLARSIKQSRQFITHRHILVDGKEINAPGYFVLMKEESQLLFKQNSALNSEDHPERSIAKQEEEIKEEADKLKEDIKAIKEEAKEPKTEGAVPEVEKKTAKKEDATPKVEEKKEEAKTEEKPVEVEKKAAEKEEATPEVEEKKEEPKTPAEESPKKEE